MVLNKISHTYLFYYQTTLPEFTLFLLKFTAQSQQWKRGKENWGFVWSKERVSLIVEAVMIFFMSSC